MGAMRWLEYMGLIGVVGIMVIRRLSANSPRIPWARPSLHLALAAAFAGGLGLIGAQALATGGIGSLDSLISDLPGWLQIARVAAEGWALVA